MAHSDIILPTEAARELPVVRSIGLRDLREALTLGLQDFWAMPTHVIFLGLIYPVLRARRPVKVRPHTPAELAPERAIRAEV